MVAYFANSNGIFAGDEVRILGVPVGKIDQDRAAARTRQDHLLVRRQVQGARRRQGRHPLAVAGDGARHPADPGLHRRASACRPTRSFRRTAPRCRWSATTSASNCRNSRETLQPTQPGGVSTLGAFVNTAADNLRGQGANIRDTIIKLSAGVLGARRPQQRPLQHREEPVDPGVGAARQHRPDAAAQREPGSGHRPAVQRSRRGRPTPSSDINDVVGDVQQLRRRQPRDARHDVGQAGVGHHRPRSRASTTSSRRCTSRPTAFQNFLNIYQPAQGTLHRRARRQQLRQPDLVPLRRDPGGVAAERRAVGQAVRAVPGADRQEPAVQLPPARREPLRRRSGPTQRDHLQRGLDASGLRSTARDRRRTCAAWPRTPADRRCRQPVRRSSVASSPRPNPSRPIRRTVCPA